MSKIYDVIILGAGPAGLAAGLYAGRSRLSTLIIEKGKDGGQIAITDEIENYPGQIVEGESGPSLIARMTQQVEKFGAERVTDVINSVELDGDVFLPIQAVNELRRAALEKLANEITGTYRREQKITEQTEERRESSAVSGEERSSLKQADGDSKERAPIYVSVVTEEQLKCAARISSWKGSMWKTRSIWEPQMRKKKS